MPQMSFVRETKNEKKNVCRRLYKTCEKKLKEKEEKRPNE